MIYSMTAYANRELQNEEIAIYWELRSVNHKYLDLTFKMPEEFRELEYALRDLIKQNINRGKLDCCLKVALVKQSSSELSIDEELAKQVITACQKLAYSINSPGLISPLEILKWPLVLQGPKLNGENVKELVQRGLQEALIILKKNKQQEGEALGEIIRQRLTEMAAQVKLINTLIPQTAKAYQTKLIGRLQELQATYDTERLAQEMLYLAQKIDINEEIDRLQVHLQETERLLEQEVMVGRRLDFMMQEINRETNTLAAKTMDPQISLAAVALKMLIEQIREQAQNLE